MSRATVQLKRPSPTRLPHEATAPRASTQLSGDPSQALALIQEVQIPHGWLRAVMVSTALLELHQAAKWLLDPHTQESQLSGLLGLSACADATPCGSGAACAAFSRVMAFALALLALVRLVVAGGSGTAVWAVGVAAHAFEAAFWWSELTFMALPRLKALPSRIQRVAALVMAVLRPPYSAMSVALLGPPLLAVWIAFSLQSFDPTTQTQPSQPPGADTTTTTPPPPFRLSEQPPPERSPAALTPEASLEKNGS